jgi:hypothetical protein
MTIWIVYVLRIRNDCKISQNATFYSTYTNYSFFLHVGIAHYIQYRRFANTVQDASEFHVENLMSGIESMSAAVTAEALKFNRTWPFVTVHLYEAIGESARAKTGLEIIMMAPWVVKSDEAAWEQYSADNYLWWRSQSQNLSVTSNTGLVPSDYKPGGTIPFIFTLDSTYTIGEGETILKASDQNPLGPFLPIWQVTPTPFNPQIINYDLLLSEDSNVAERVGDAFQSRDALFGPIERLDRLGETVVKLADHEAFHASLVKYVKDTTNSTYEHPHCALFQPIFEQLHDDSKIVGFLNGIVPWDRYLVDLLPDGVRGITCVLRLIQDWSRPITSRVDPFRSYSLWIAHIRLEKAKPY